MPRLIQPSFARGEIGPDLYGRVDISAYSVSLRTAINAVIHSYGGASNRPGLKYVAPCKTHTGTAPKLIEFKYNTTDRYILEFGDEYMRVIRNDALVLNSAVSITGVTQADPGVVTASSHGFSDGDQVFISGVVGMTELNGRYFTVANKTTHTFELTSQQTGSDVDTSGYTAYSSGGEVSSVYEIATPYDISHVGDLNHVQSANVMTLVHPSYAPRELSRTDHDDWTLSEITFAPSQAYPTNVSLTVNSSGSSTRSYKVTALNKDTLEESLPGLFGTSVNISGATQANPVVVTTGSNHNLLSGEEVQIDSVVGMTELNGRRFTVTKLTNTTFELDGEDGTGHTAYSSAGTVTAAFFRTATSSSTENNTVSWDKAAEASRYSVYREDGNGVFGWIGDAEGTSFTDVNMDPDYTLSPPKARNPFFGSGNYPSSVSYYQQRRVFGNTDDQPDTSWYSVTGSQDNMAQSTPRQADDSITVTLNSLEVNEIRAFVPLNDLLVFTSGAEWRVHAGTDNPFSAESLRQKPQSQWGSANIQPIVIGDKVLFVTENQTYVRSLGYDITVDGYKGNDMTVFAPHLFTNYTLDEWALTNWPDPMVSCVRNDGWVCALTFNPEQEVVAWSRWNTDGKFKRVASTRPSSSDKDTFSYFVVSRTIGGSPALYIERVASRRFTDVRDCFFVDSGLSLDNPVSISSVTSANPVVVTTSSAHGLSDGDEVDISDILWAPSFDSFYNETQPDQVNDRRFYVADKTSTTLSLVSTSGRVDVEGATQANPVVISATGHGFSDGDKIGIFNISGMTELNGRTFTVANKTDDTFELSGEDGTGHTSYTSGGQAYPCEDGTAFSAYVEGGYVRQPFATIGGLWHLEGKEVVALADGNVVSGKTVSGGVITLSSKASRVHVGLRYVSDLQTLDPEFPGQTIQGKPIRVPRATIRFKDSRGLAIGPTFEDLEEMKQREFEVYGQPTQLLTGDKEIDLESDWETGGRICMRQIHPLPMTILAVVPFLDVGDEDEDE